MAMIPKGWGQEFTEATVIVRDIGWEIYLWTIVMEPGV